jgi:CelD/BcsL family acetyltransferase involved in cellulose biosynthesis
LVGILPLTVEGATVGFLGAPHSDYNDIVCGPRFAEEVVNTAMKALAELHIPWTRCALHDVPEESRLVRHLRAVKDRSRVKVQMVVGNPCPRTVLTSDKEDTVASILKKKSLRRHENKLRRLGEVIFYHVESREEIRSYLPEFFQQHIAQRARVGDRSLFCDAAACHFYEALVDELDPRSDLRFAVVKVSGNPVAFHFGFEVNRVFVWYKPTFAIDYSEYSPGEVLIKKLFEYVGTREIDAFDFTIGGEAYKYRFANEVETNYSIFLFPAGICGAMRRVGLQGKDYVRTTHPKLFKRLKMMASIAGDFRGSLRRRLQCDHSG